MTGWLLLELAAIAVQLLGLVLMAIGIWRMFRRGDDDLVGRGATFVLMGAAAAIAGVTLEHVF